MEGKKRIGIILFVIGIILCVGSLVTDLVGIGTSPGIGSNQMIGLIVGALVAIVGAVLAFKPKKE